MRNSDFEQAPARKGVSSSSLCIPVLTKASNTAHLVQQRTPVYLFVFVALIYVCEQHFEIQGTLLFAESSVKTHRCFRLSLALVSVYRLWGFRSHPSNSVLGTTSYSGCSNHDCVAQKLLSNATSSRCSYSEPVSWASTSGTTPRRGTFSTGVTEGDIPCSRTLSISFTPST